MQSNLSILFYIKKNAPKKNGIYTVFGRITINKKDAVFSTKVDTTLDDWDAIEQGRNIRCARAKESKQRLDLIRTKAQEYYWMLYERGQEPDANSIKALLSGEKQSEETLLKLFDKMNEQLNAGIGQTISKKTFSRYILVRERLAMYLKDKHHVNDIGIRCVNLSFVQDFEAYLRSNFAVNTNIVYKYMQYLKRLCRNAFHSGIISTYPFGEYKLRKEKTTIWYLTEEELYAIMSKKFDVKRLDEIRDIFVFSCFTGLSYCDVQKLTTDQINSYIDGKKWILTSRDKTGNNVNVKLFDVPRMISKHSVKCILCAA